VIYTDFYDAIHMVSEDLKYHASIVDAPRWQSIYLPKVPAVRMRELFDVHFQVILGSQDPEDYHREIKPNLPWADNAFFERVDGVPWNPGLQWANWPWARSASQFKEQGRFSHSYAERYWPKLASNLFSDAIVQQGGAQKLPYNHDGIRYAYGDLKDVVTHLFNDPLSRQAYLPVWFPEDTGVVHGERVPCTLGYHFLMRDGYFHCTYLIRSCDFIRHFRDDLYMTLRLQLWVLGKLRGMETLLKKPPFWAHVEPGNFVFNCTSLHCFEGDYIKLFGAEHAGETASKTP